MRPVVLDSSFLIALQQEVAARRIGPARRFLPRLRGRVLVVSVVTVEEVLEGSRDEDATLAYLCTFVVQAVSLAQARRCAVLQRRSGHRLGENDAWLVATADLIDADIVAADRATFERLGDRYLQFNA